MAHRFGASRTHRDLGAFALTATLASALALPLDVAAQGKREAVVQIEVGDSIGLPLPDAKTEVFTFMDGGVFWEWVPLGTSALPEGINLLRFSYPGYQSTTFSVPVRNGTTLSLRVRLDPERDTTKSKKDVIEARAVRAIGLVIEGRAHTDIVGRRRVLEHRDFENESSTRFGTLMRRARNTDLKVLPASGGSFRVFAQSSGGRFGCPMQVMVNGDRRRVLPFETFDQMFGVSDAETIEIFPMGSSIPLSYQVVPRATCGLMVVWFKSL
jgi:hypothetical protein